tara:strand:+ start:13569 stop:14312 length:744 start_codon:yes stop_codon:yes gene_type:complete
MSDTTTRLLLPYILAAQAQKHVTHNEALRRLDGLINLTVKDRTRTAPPATPTEGQAHLVAGGASGLWAGWSGDIAVWTDGSWLRLPAQPGWRLWVIDESVMLVRVSVNWIPLDVAMGLIIRGATVSLAEGVMGSTTSLGIIDATVSGMTGSAVTASLILPANALILGVTARVTTPIVGATGFALGIAGEPELFGTGYAPETSTEAVGVIGPRAFATATLVVVTAEGGSFTGGALNLACHTLTLGAPT